MSDTINQVVNSTALQNKLNQKANTSDVTVAENRAKSDATTKANAAQSAAATDATNKANGITVGSVVTERGIKIAGGGEVHAEGLVSTMYCR